MSESEIFEQPAPEIPIPKPRKKRVMTEEQRAKALDNLKKGRETIKQRRMMKNKAPVAIEIEKNPEPKKPKIDVHIGDSNEDIDDEIKNLRAEIVKFKNEKLNQDRTSMLKEMKHDLAELRKEKKQATQEPPIEKKERVALPVEPVKPKEQPKTQVVSPPIQLPTPSTRRAYNVAPWVL